MSHLLDPIDDVHEQIVREFEQSLSRGESPELASFAARARPSARLLVELIRVEMEYAIASHSAGRVESYLNRFPILRDDRNATLDLIEAEFEQRSLLDPKSVSVEEFRDRFGELWESLESRLEKFPPPSKSRSELPSDLPTLIHAGFNPRSSSDRVAPASARTEPLAIGQTIGDFELLEILGRGSFGIVYLVRQISLSRYAALKISDHLGSEARTMAMLEHDHIVQVFSETVDEQIGSRLVCMQYIPGPSIGKVIRHWKGERMDPSGAAFLETVDTLSPGPFVAKRASFKDRDILSKCDWIDAVVWLGSRLAEALGYAHRQGVLHRDIKPDNILISQQGRPYLADFSLSIKTSTDRAHEIFGGSPNYMAPEHLHAMISRDPATQDAVDERSDIYSLAIVLVELMALRLPFRHTMVERATPARLAEMATERQQPVTTEGFLPLEARKTLAPIFDRCLHPLPSERYATAEQLSADLEAAGEFHGMMRLLPRGGAITRFAERSPIAALVLAALLPHLFGSLVNIGYNSLYIVPHLTEAQQKIFVWVVLGYNLIIYPLCLAILIAVARPVFRQLRVASRPRRVAARQRATMLPTAVTAVSCLGWLPGGVLFPALIHIASGPLAPEVFGHFLADFSISGMIAATYSFFAVEAIVIRILFPRFLVGESEPRRIARVQLRSARRRLWFAQALSGAIPLSGAVLLVAVGPSDGGYDGFRILVCALIGAGLIGFCVSVSLTSLLIRMISVYTDSDVRGSTTAALG